MPRSMTTLCGLFALGLLAGATGARADCMATAELTAGEEETIATWTGGPDEVTATAKHGTLRVEAIGDERKLLYKAKPTATVATDTIACPVDGGVATIAVTVNPAPSAPRTDLLQGSGTVLLLIFALAAILEAALAGLVRWPPFAGTFNPRGVAPALAFGLALVIVAWSGVDVVAAVLNTAYPAQPMNASVIGGIITALVIAGGSRGIAGIFRAFGLQAPSSAPDLPRPPSTAGWISVRAVRRTVELGDIDVFIGARAPAEAPGAPAGGGAAPGPAGGGGPAAPAGGAAPAAPAGAGPAVAGGAAPAAPAMDGQGLPPIVGTIKGRSRDGIAAFFLRDRGRFPAYGGYEVPANTAVTVVLRPQKPGGKPVEAVWGPFVIGGRAIVDLDLEI